MNDNKRIAINTVILYTKLLITVVCSLLMARFVLKALGASDYGLYNVVGGIVAMLNIVGTSMVATSYRYMAVEIGKGQNGDPNKIFNTILLVHIFLAILLLILGETIGVFYIEKYLNVSNDKVPDALFVLHLSLLTTAFAVITIPSNGLIIAREKFLFTSIIESSSAIIRIALAILLMYLDGNRLRIYAVFLAITQFINPLAYQIYCRIKDKDIIKWRLNKNYTDYKNVLGFTSWMLLGAVAVIGKTQGAAMIINFFFGTILNAAFGIAAQVSNSVTQFTGTLRQAAVPQIMKNQSAGNEDRSLNLVYSMSRYSYLCMCVISMPLFFCMDDLLLLWLGDAPPKYTKVFIIYLLVAGMISNLSAGFDASIQSTGKVKKNQLGFSLINISLLPIIYFLYKIGLPPYTNVIVTCFIALITLIFQTSIMKELTNFNIKRYLNDTVIPSILSTTLSAIPLFVIYKFWGHSLFALILFVIFGVIWTVISIFLCGLNYNERKILCNIINNKILKK